MSLSDDPWIAEHSFIDPERLHAIGVVILWWSQCEYNLIQLFGIIFDLTPRRAWIIAHDIGDMSLDKKIREWLNFQTPSRREELDLVYNYLDIYDVCRQNRNALTHLKAETPVGKPDDLANVSFKKLRGRLLRHTT
jgi:hypothetical protein